MSEHDLEKLLGGFAANTLTPEERSQLYRAALQDQQLFNALADEQALKELLADPDVRRRLLQTLQQPVTSEPGGARPWWAWFRKPAGLAFAGGLAAAVFAIAFGTRIYQESVDRAAQSVVTEESKPAVPSVQPSQPSMQPSPPPAATELKAKPRTEPAKKETRTDTLAKRERSAPIVTQDRSTDSSLAENAMPRRERDELGRPAPLATTERAAKPAPPLPDRKLATPASPPPNAPAPAAAPAPLQAPATVSAAATPAPKKNARALFYGQASTQADHPEPRTDQFALAGKAGGASGQVKPLGVRYSFVTRDSSGQSQEVSVATAARSKEPVRISVEATQDAYLQLLQNLGSAGTRLWWPPQETGKISLKLLAGKRSEIPMPPPAENGLITLIIRLSPKPFGPLTMQEVGMLDRFSANLLTESVSAGAQEQATYVVSQDPSTSAQLAVEIPVSP